MSVSVAGAKLRPINVSQLSMHWWSIKSVGYVSSELTVSVKHLPVQIYDQSMLPTVHALVVYQEGVGYVSSELTVSVKHLPVQNYDQSRLPDIPCIGGLLRGYRLCIL